MGRNGSGPEGRGRSLLGGGETKPISRTGGRLCSLGHADGVGAANGGSRIANHECRFPRARQSANGEWRMERFSGAPKARRHPSLGRSPRISRRTSRPGLKARPIRTAPHVDGAQRAFREVVWCGPSALKGIGWAAVSWGCAPGWDGARRWRSVLNAPGRSTSTRRRGDPRGIIIQGNQLTQVTNGNQDVTQGRRRYIDRHSPFTSPRADSIASRVRGMEKPAATERRLPFAIRHPPIASHSCL